MANYTPRYQELKKSGHREAIISALNAGPKQFKELEKMFEFSHTTLSKHLKDLQRAKIIEKDVQDGKLVYVLTRKGENAYNEIFVLENELAEMKERKGKYLSGGAPLQKDLNDPLFWPTLVHLAIDKNIENIFQMIPKEYLYNIQENLVLNLLYNIQKKRLHLDENKDGKIILGISIDYSDLAKMVKYNSYEKWKKLWNQEKTIDTIWIQDSITPHRRPYVLQYHIKEKRK